jgi:4-diphosphocytidyl-2-C-methyl-D-erythritol kinase
MRTLQLRPHAKLNLGLRILGRRPDGYHDLQTRFQTVDLCDEMDLEPSARTIRVRVEGADLAGDANNLVVRAAQALRATRRGLPGASILLRKRIPIAAGLGGGSSDAAATLLGLCRLWELTLPDEEVRGLAADLGADVPFFLVGGCARGSGRGDLIAPLPDPPAVGVALVLPPLASSTEKAFRLWDQRGGNGASRAEAEKEFEAAVASQDFSSRGLANDFEPLLRERFPLLGDCLERLLRRGASAAALSGSGPSLYGLFRDEESLLSALQDPDWGPVRCLRSAPVGRSEYRRRLGIPVSD